MSTQEFKPGDKVRCIETWTTSVVDRGDEFTVADVRGTASGVQQVLVDGEWVPARYFEKVAPEWTVGQTVRGGDYARLPVGSVVLEEEDDDAVKSVPITKTGADEWTNQGHPGVFASADLSYDERTLTHLGDGIADVEIVEPEPLKDDAVVLVWARVRSAVPDCDGEIKIALHRADSQDKEYWTLPDGIVRPNEGQVPPWIEPAQVLTDGERDRIMLAYRDGVLAPGQAVLIEVEDIIRERTKGGAS